MADPRIVGGPTSLWAAVDAETGQVVMSGTGLWPMLSPNRDAVRGYAEQSARQRGRPTQLVQFLRVAGGDVFWPPAPPVPASPTPRVQRLIRTAAAPAKPARASNRKRPGRA